MVSPELLQKLINHLSVGIVLTVRDHVVCTELFLLLLNTACTGAQKVHMYVYRLNIKTTSLLLLRIAE